MNKKELVNIDNIKCGTIGKYEYISAGFYEEKKSKFYSYVFKVERKEDIENIICEAKKEFREARHVVYAYTLQNTYGYSDDGEPSGTAGKIIYSLLEKQSVINILIIVIRHFGGILLGTGPLSRAYLKSAQLAEESLDMIDYIPKSTISIVIEYSEEGIIKNLIQQNKAEILDVNYQDKIKYKINVPENTIQCFKKYQNR